LRRLFQSPRPFRATFLAHDGLGPTHPVQLKDAEAMAYLR
jgi:hypothetical protein